MVSSELEERRSGSPRFATKQEEFPEGLDSLEQGPGPLPRADLLSDEDL